jgi:RNA polymerase sigma factor (sigma-70 family)
VAEEQLRVVATGAVDPVEVSERDALVDELQGELVRAMASLDADDRLLLKMRYCDRQTVPQIAQRLGLEAKPLYARMRRLLGRVRARLERAGLGGDNARSLVRSRAPEIDLDGVFSAA